MDSGSLAAQRTDAPPATRMFCTALAAGHLGLERLRYDYPLVLDAHREGSSGLRPLRDIVDACLAHIAPRGAAGEALRRRGLALEAELRRTQFGRAPAPMAGRLDEAIASMSAADDGAELAADLQRIRAGLQVDGLLVDCGGDTAYSVVRYLWRGVFSRRMRATRARIDRLAQRLSDLLRAADLASPRGRQPAALRQALPGSFREAFNFEVLSDMLDGSNRRGDIPAARRQRIESTLAVLREQRLFAADPEQVARFWQFQTCAGAVEAFRGRLPELIALLRAMRIADLELEHHYHAALHDAYFADFSEDDLSPADFESMPGLLVYVRNPDIAEQGAILQALDTNLPVKILVQHDDILRELPLAAGKFSLGTHGGQLGRMALSVDGACVVQCGSAQLARVADWLEAGMEASVPALFNVYAGVVDGGPAPYLLSAAAAEARAFPSFYRNPQAIVALGDLLGLSRNPQASEDWPVYRLLAEDPEQQRTEHEQRFTFADFASLDTRYGRHFAPIDTATARSLPVDAWLHESDHDAAATIRLAGPDRRVQVCAVDDALLHATRRCLASWHSLCALNGPPAQTAMPAATTQPEPDTPPAPAEPAAASAPGTAYIETPRCTTCEECVHINPRMFAYNADKQAYIADRQAGSYRDLVEAAESCQLSIIHPGEPLDPDEPGLDQLRERAQPFL